MSIDARLDVIGLVVADMAASLAFYRRLGLDIPADADAAATRGGRVARRAATALGYRGHHPVLCPGMEGGRTSLAFRLPDPAAVDAAYVELTAAGYHGEHPPWDALWGQRYAVVHDPDGLGVDLFAPLGG